jgi:catechol 2,3-dioxygenase-like lactoylglutathione lyase family enzyme
MEAHDMISGVNGVHHIALSVPDLAVARRFYVDLLGFEVVWEASWDASFSNGNEVAGSVIDEILQVKNTAADQLMLRAGNVYLEFFKFSQPAQAPQNPSKPVHSYGYTHLALDVTGIQSLYERLRAAGMDFHTSPKQGPKMLATYGRDPFGNVIELQELHPGSAVPHL